MIIIRRGIIPPASGTAPDSAAYTNFNARASLSAPYTTYYKTLLDGLTTDGFFDGSGNSTLLDALYIFCGPNDGGTVANLNLVKNSFNITANGSPTYTTNQGYTGTDGSNTVYLNTGFNASTAGGNYGQNSASFSVWSNNATSSAGIAIGAFISSGTESYILPRFNGDDKFYGRINKASGATDSASSAANTGQGYYGANRSGSAAVQLYKNGSDPGDEGTGGTSGSLVNGEVYILNASQNNAPTGSGWAGQASAAHIGASLNSTQWSNLYSRIGAFRTSVGL